MRLTQLDCVQSKALDGIPAEKGTEHFPGGEYVTNLIITNAETLSHDDSNSHSFSSDGHEFEFGGHCPLDPPLR